MFIKDKTKVACRMSGIEWRLVYFRKLLFETNNEKFRTVHCCRPIVHVPLLKICVRSHWNLSQISGHLIVSI